MTFYAMGDIHGQLALLQGAHALIAEDRARHGMAEDTPIVHLGDLVDRAPDARALTLMAAIEKGEGGPDVMVL